jgi:hypothetical protein
VIQVFYSFDLCHYCQCKYVIGEGVQNLVNVRLKSQGQVIGTGAGEVLFRADSFFRDLSTEETAGRHPGNIRPLSHTICKLMIGYSFVYIDNDRYQILRVEWCHTIYNR